MSRIYFDTKSKQEFKKNIIDVLTLLYEYKNNDPDSDISEFIGVLHNITQFKSHEITLILKKITKLPELSDLLIQPLWNIIQEYITYTSIITHYQAQDEYGEIQLFFRTIIVNDECIIFPFTISLNKRRIYYYGINYSSNDIIKCSSLDPIICMNNFTNKYYNKRYFKEHDYMKIIHYNHRKDIILNTRIYKNIIIIIRVILNCLLSMKTQIHKPH